MKLNYKNRRIIMKNYKVIFEVRGLENSTFNKIEELEGFMGDELLRVYNIYANKTNGGVTKILNEEFENLYPNYFKDNEDKELFDLIEYKSYISEGYQRLIVDDLNKQNISPILDFYVEPTEIAFTGYLKADSKVTISFYLKEV